MGAHVAYARLVQPVRAGRVPELPGKEASSLWPPSSNSSRSFNRLGAVPDWCLVPPWSTL
jgi:hypothetical protein